MDADVRHRASRLPPAHASRSEAPSDKNAAVESLDQETPRYGSFLRCHDAARSFALFRMATACLIAFLYITGRLCLLAGPRNAGVLEAWTGSKTGVWFEIVVLYLCVAFYMACVTDPGLLPLPSTQQQSGDEAIEGGLEVLTTQQMARLWRPRLSDVHASHGDKANADERLRSVRSALEAVANGSRRTDSSTAGGQGVDDLIEGIRYCRGPSCLSFKPPRTHHCRKCGRCVARMDHHCPYLSTCVGGANHGHFMRFLCAVIVACGHLSLCGAGAFVRIAWTPIWTEEVPLDLIAWTPVLATTAAWAASAIVTFTVSVLLGYQVYEGVLHGSTTVEAWTRQRVERLVRRSQMSENAFPYDADDLLRNAEAVMGTSPGLLAWRWIWPFAQPRDSRRYTVVDPDFDHALGWPPDVHDEYRSPPTGVIEHEGSGATENMVQDIEYIPIDKSRREDDDDEPESDSDDDYWLNGGLEREQLEDYGVDAKHTLETRDLACAVGRSVDGSEITVADLLCWSP